MTLGERLKYAREKIRNLKQKELEEISGVKQQIISRVEKGEIKRTKYLPELAKALKINLSWLLSGKGEPELDKDKQEPEKISPVPLISWDEINALLEQRIDENKIKKTEIYIQTQDDHPIFRLVVNNNAVTDKDNVSGIKPGEEVLIDTKMEPTPGAFVIAKVDDSYVLRKYIEDGSIKRLEPLNDRYPIIELNQTVKIIGCVAMVLRKV